MTAAASASSFHRDEGFTMIVRDIERDNHLTSFGEPAQKVYKIVMSGDVPSQESVKSALEDLAMKTKKVGEKLKTALITVEAEYEKEYAAVKITEAMALESALKIKRMPVLDDIVPLTDDFWKMQIPQMARDDEGQLSVVHRTGYLLSHALAADKEFYDAYSFGKEKQFLDAVLRGFDAKESPLTKEEEKKA